MVDEPGFAPRVTRRIDGLVAPLQQALRVREAAVLLGVRGGGEEEHLGRNLVGSELAALHLGRIQPEGRRLGFDHVAHDQPLEVGERAPLEPRVGRADGRVLPHHEQPVEPIRPSIVRIRRTTVRHVEPVAEVRMIAADARQPAEAEVVLRGRLIAVPGLEQRDRHTCRSSPTSRPATDACRCICRASMWPRRMPASGDSPAGCRRAWGCPWIPEWTRGRAAPGCRRLAGRYCRGAAGGSRPCG